MTMTLVAALEVLADSYTTASDGQAGGFNVRSTPRTTMFSEAVQYEAWEVVRQHFSEAKRWDEQMFGFRLPF